MSDGDKLAKRREDLKEIAIEMGVEDAVGDQPNNLLAIGAYAFAIDIPEFLAFNVDVELDEIMEYANELRARGLPVNA